jgi:hypothetical protein
MDITRALALTAQHAVNETELGWLAKTAESAHVIIEIGSFIGRSTLALVNSPGTVYCVDPWDWRGGTTLTGGHMTHVVPPPGHYDPTRPVAWSKDDVYAIWYENLKDFIDAGRVIPVRALAADALPYFVEKGIKADLIFIDSSHTYPATQWEIANYSPLLRDAASVLSGHDYDWPKAPAGQAGVTKAVNEAFPGPNRVGHCDTIWFTRPLDPNWKATPTWFTT